MSDCESVKWGKGGNFSTIIEIMQSVVMARQDSVAMDLCLKHKFSVPLHVAFIMWSAWAAGGKKICHFLHNREWKMEH